MFANYTDDQKTRLADAEAELEAAVDANYEASKKKKFEGSGADDLSKIKDIEHRVLKSIPQTKVSKISCLAWGPKDGDVRMGIADQGGSVFIWDTTKATRMYGCVSSFAQCLAISPDVDNPTILVGGMRNSTVLFRKEADSAIMKPLKTWIAHDGYISSLHYLDGGKKYISSSGDADIRIFEIDKPQTDCYQVIRGHTKDCQSIKFPRDDMTKNVFITCSSDKMVKKWDLRIPDGCTASYMTDSELNACTITGDGMLIGCGGEKDKTYVFDVRAHKQVGKYARNNMKTASCEFSASGRELYVGHDDGAIIVWDIFGSGANKEYAKKIEAHTTYFPDKKVNTTCSRVAVLDVGPGGYLASGGFDGTCKLWGPPVA